MPTGSQDKAFAETMTDLVDAPKMSTNALDSAIDWISSNLNPEDVFSDNDLQTWAESNGYTKE